MEVKSNDKYTIRSLIRFHESFHQRIGGSYVIHPKNLSVKEGVVYLACLYDFLFIFDKPGFDLPSRCIYALKRAGKKVSPLILASRFFCFKTIG